MIKKNFKTKLRQFGYNVCNYRKHNKITLEELSAKTKISKAYLNRIENGTADKISTYHIFVIANALGISAQLLVEGI